MNLDKKELGIYIHIPFCKQKCYYCDFTSFAGCEHLQGRYVECLKKELQYRLRGIEDNYKITTIYIGGGTPSYIDSKYIKEILTLLMNEIPNSNVSSKQSDKLKIDNDYLENLKLCDVETTIEVNPGTVTEQKLRDYKEAGINRLSIGLQSTNNELLKEIGRIHDYEQFIETFNLARKVGFKNINVDLMLALPNQTIEDLKESLQKVIKHNPEHISVYSLILEKETKLYDMVNEGKLKLPDEELERQMYWYVKNTLELNGYEHYEISNFAKTGMESKHNVNCWKQKEYIGIGLGASSYVDGVRFSNIKDLEEYIANVEAGKIDKNTIVEEMQTETDKQKEYMMLGLRMIDGVSIQEFKAKFGKNPIYLFRQELDKLTKEKLIVIDGDKIKLSNMGLDLANQVWMEFA